MTHIHLLVQSKGSDDPPTVISNSLTVIFWPFRAVLRRFFTFLASRGRSKHISDVLAVRRNVPSTLTNNLVQSRG